MKCFLAISLCVLAALALTSNAASIHDKPATVSTTRTSKDAVTLTTSTSEESTTGSVVADQLNRAKRTLGVDKNVKKEYEIKTKHGTSLKISKSVTYNDGGGLTMLPALIDSIGSNRRKLIYALRGYKYCNGCVSGESSDESNELPADDIFGSNNEVSASAQADGQIRRVGEPEAEATVEAVPISNQSEISAVANSQASAQVSSEAEDSAIASSQALAQASSQAQSGGSSQAQAVAESSNQAGGSGGCGDGCAGGITSDNSQASAQAVAQVSSQIVVSDGCGGYGCEDICGHIMPVLLTPVNRYGQFRSRHPLHISPFSRTIRRHIGSKFRPLLPVHYPMNTLCSPYYPCCLSHRK